MPLNLRHTAAELRYAVEDSGAKVLFSGVGDQGLDGVVDQVVDLGDGYEARRRRADRPQACTKASSGSTGSAQSGTASFPVPLRTASLLLSDQ